MNDSPSVDSSGSPDSLPQLFGPLYRDVQREAVFDDSKTFVDCVPETDPDSVYERYAEQQDEFDFRLERFVRDHFDLPDRDYDSPAFDPDRSMEEHVEALWDHLVRGPDTDVDEGSTRIRLPDTYVVPGGRFRELYYWDAYFTAEGLAAHDRVDVVESLASNYADLVDRFGHVPNGTREYLSTRSQPPVFYRLVSVLERELGRDAVEPYLDALDDEYEFWMRGADDADVGAAARRVVRLDDDVVLNRYWDPLTEPRPESYREDRLVARNCEPDDRPAFYRNVRAACESGWDFSSRWRSVPDDPRTVRTTELVPVDLNAFLFEQESVLADWFRAVGDDGTASEYESRAAARRDAVETYCWDDEREFYVDYVWTDGEPSERETLAAVVPLFTGLADEERAAAVADRLESSFLVEGGLVTTLEETGEQWDWPNGWAPLHYMAVEGLRNYGHDALAADVRERWLATNRRTYERTGKLVEKYDVVDPDRAAGGGEYDLQDGFGWTNGVVAAWTADA